MQGLAVSRFCFGELILIFKRKPKVVPASSVDKSLDEDSPEDAFGGLEIFK
jgi:hypothetical protein